jgi:hypothetical protein
VRWSAYAATLPPRQFTRVVNLLTTGYGYAYLAARAAERDGPSSLVLSRLRQARTHLDEALQILTTGSSGRTLPANGHSAPNGNSSGSWRTLLAARTADVAQTAALLADAVVDAHRTADSIQEDADVEHIRQRLRTTLNRLTRVLEMGQLLLLR